MTLTLLAFLALIVIGTPIVLALGVSAALAIVAADIPVGIICQHHIQRTARNRKRRIENVEPAAVDPLIK